MFNLVRQFLYDNKTGQQVRHTSGYTSLSIIVLHAVDKSSVSTDKVRLIELDDIMGK